MPKLLRGVNDLVTLNPDFLKEWDYDKNIGLDPSDFMLHSNKKVWWKCSLGHSWQATIGHRSYGSKCPHCYKEHGTSFAEQAILFYLSKFFNTLNRCKVYGKEIDIFLPEQNIGFEYDGIYFHRGKTSELKEASKNLVLSENGITLYRIKESNKNEFDAQNRVIYTLPDRNYQYLERVIKTILVSILHIKEYIDFDIDRDSNSIYLQYINQIKENNILSVKPELENEWDYELNKGLKPEHFLSGSNKKVWWKCKKCGSSYQSSIVHKMEGNDCPYCSGKKVNNTNSLSAKCQHILRFWDYSKNCLSPDKIYFSSRKKVFWICEKCGKSFESPIYIRITSKTNFCNTCMHEHIGAKNREITLNKTKSLFENKELMKDWDFEKNKNLDPRLIPEKSGLKVWWKCNKCGYESYTSVANRTYGYGCKHCNNLTASQKRKKRILQIDKNGKVVNEYVSLKDATTRTGLKSICSVVGKGNRTAGGYYWKYAENN
jgi:DNA-directed RNA polymerase subunit RPC12/RpoP